MQNEFNGIPGIIEQETNDIVANVNTSLDTTKADLLDSYQTVSDQLKTFTEAVSKAIEEIKNASKVQNEYEDYRYISTVTLLFSTFLTRDPHV